MKSETVVPLASVKEGDRVVLYRSDGGREIRTVRFASGTLIDIGTGSAAYHFIFENGRGVARRGGLTNERIEVATNDLVENVEAENALKAMTLRDAKLAEEADPRTPLIKLLRNGDFAPWHTLKLEQLKQIIHWLYKE